MSTPASSTNQAKIAIQLCEAVKDVSSLDRLGTWRSGEKEYIDGDDDPEEEEESSSEEKSSEDEDMPSPTKNKRKPEPKELTVKIVDQIKQIAERATMRSYVPGWMYSISSSHWVTIDGEKKEIGEFTEDQVIKLHGSASVSGFGDMKKMETVVDENVRKARELGPDRVEVDPLLVRYLEAKWSETLMPADVAIKFYKLNIYGPGGRFSAHKDTPESGLIGTALVNVFDSTGDRNNFILDHKIIKFGSGDIMLFFTDVVHEVLEIEKGYRVTLAFKVFAKQQTLDQADYKQLNHNAAVVKIAGLLQNRELPYGLLLSHEYVLEDNPQLKGQDLLLEEALKQLPGVKLNRLPVVVTLQGTSQYSEGPSGRICHTAVYPFTDKHIDFLLEKRVSPPKDMFKEHIEFFSFGTNFVWSEQEESAVAHTGNESRAGSKDSIYFNHAIIVSEKSEKKQKKK